ncbi:hypothetical protein DER29_5811 [Micromonospora sp. M71_S20]|nr:hypothetical protein DER29_5811 [Micromonospora sp. M71_S20]
MTTSIRSYLAPVSAPTFSSTGTVCADCLVTCPRSPAVTPCLGWWWPALRVPPTGRVGPGRPRSARPVGWLTWRVGSGDEVIGTAAQQLARLLVQHDPSKVGAGRQPRRPPVHRLRPNTGDRRPGRLQRLRPAGSPPHRERRSPAAAGNLGSDRARMQALALHTRDGQGTGFVAARTERPRRPVRRAAQGFVPPDRCSGCPPRSRCSSRRLPTQRRGVDPPAPLTRTLDGRGPDGRLQSVTAFNAIASVATQQLTGLRAADVALHPGAADLRRRGAAEGHDRRGHRHVHRAGAERRGLVRQ